MAPHRYNRVRGEQVEICISIELKHDSRLILSVNSLPNIQKACFLPPSLPLPNSRTLSPAGTEKERGRARCLLLSQSISVAIKP